ncbi:MAG: hypothetical protein V1910_00955 [bacterium]
MRTTLLNIAISPIQKKNVDHMIKDYNYASVSEFFCDAVRALENDRLIKELKESQRDAKMGKIKLLHSLKELR